MMKGHFGLCVVGYPLSVFRHRLFASGALVLVLLLALSPSAEAQLRVQNEGRNAVLPLLSGFSGGAAGAMSGWKSKEGTFQLSAYSGALPLVNEPGFSLLNRPYFAPATAAPLSLPNVPTPFDFTQTAPHLAFFCRLEINEAAGYVIPAKFRLGGHRYWQDDLFRR